MSYKPIVIAVGILIVAQILFFGSLQSATTARVNRRLLDLQAQSRQLAQEKTMLFKKQKELREVITLIPPSLLTGFEDPETGLVEFMDYLHSPVLDSVSGKVSLRGQQFTTTPIPLHATGFTFNYVFTDTSQAEKFLEYLLFQERFPLKVTGFSAKRVRTGVVGGEVSVALLIPAKLKFELPSLEEAEGK